VDGVRTDRVPYDVYAEVEPVYTTLKGWDCDLGACRSEAELPAAFKDYVAFIEREVGVPVRILSLGPDREQTIIRG
jgi:adenylosuccinate synthase